jgi:hypothetical protein
VCVRSSDSERSALLHVCVAWRCVCVCVCVCCVCVLHGVVWSIWPTDHNDEVIDNMKHLDVQGPVMCMHQRSVRCMALCGVSAFAMSVWKVLDV